MQKIFSRRKTIKSMVELKEYGKQYRKIMPEEGKQQKKEYLKDQRKVQSNHVMKKIKENEK